MILASGGLACEVVSGLDGLEPVDCLDCGGALRSDSAFEAAVVDGPPAERPDESGSDSGVDTREPDVLGSDAGTLDSSGCDADPECGSPACTYMHANGLGETFVDCTPKGTYDLAQATEACASYTGDSSQCRAATCGATSVVCSSAAALSCACWAFAGAGTGHVESSGQPGALNCVCPGPTAPGWN